MNHPNPTRTASRYRISPAPWVGVVMVLLYIVVVFGLHLGTGIPYAEWTATAANGVRATVIPLAAGAVLLIIFVAIARWDMVWRDPGRLPMTTVMKVAMGFFVLCIVVRFVGIQWGGVDRSALLAGVLVGFAEELLFRGIFLRSMRTNGRNEAVAALWTAIVFGLFHLPNLLVAGPAQLGQILLAAASGATLYVFRRQWGLILTAMIAHGVWDISTFLSIGNASDWFTLIGLGFTFISFVLGIAVLVSIWRTDKTTVVTPEGIEQKQV